MKTETLLVNEQISYAQVRVTDADGNQLGVMATQKAIDIADDEGLDLVLLTDRADIPVCRIVDANKFAYQKKQERKESLKKQRESKIETKEIQLKLNIDTHDLLVKAKRALEFVNRGDIVRVVVRFKGREMANKQSGLDLVDQFLGMLGDDVIKESGPSYNGNRMITIVRKKV